MPRKIKISDTQRAWLRKNHAALTIAEISVELGCHDDTTKRILMREGLRHFSGAKYVLSRTYIEHDVWRRPCMNCGCKKPRPRNQYICDPCHQRMDR